MINSRMRWRRHTARIERRGMHMILMVKPEGKRSLGRPTSGWEQNIKMDVEEIKCVGI
jgi:hypothetical protein